MLRGMGNKLADWWAKWRAEIEALLDERSLFGKGERGVTPWQQFCHFWLMVGRNFVDNRCPVRASALAYATLLALIPLLAVGIGVSATFLKSSKFDKELEASTNAVAHVDGVAGTNVVVRIDEETGQPLEVKAKAGPAADDPVQKMVNTLVDEIAPQLGLISDTRDKSAADARAEVVKKINEFIANIHSGTLGITGTIALIGVAILLLSNIETTFNDIWGVAHGRNWVSRAVQYWAVITLGPLFMVLALGVTVSGRFAFIRSKMQEWPIMSEMFFTLVPLVVLIIIFTVFYQLIPNTKVKPSAALIGGLVGGGLWTANSTFNVLFASKVITASKVYGSLGAIPVFLSGLYFSWLILLFGAQVAYAFQNRQTYMQERQAETIHQRGREFVAFRIMEIIGERFAQGGKPPTAVNLASSIEVPSRLVVQIMLPLVEAKLVNEVVNGETAYTPARPIERITCADILNALRCGNGHGIETKEEPARETVRNDFELIQDAEQKTAAEITIAELVRHAVERRAIEEARALAEAAAKPKDEKIWKEGAEEKAKKLKE
ncbi:MAG: ribonuclease BN-like protein [Verrucomicrobia bacterium]|nr:ribonuclease BN-like protein [Verrucomicrobiota bacterium]